MVCCFCCNRNKKPLWHWLYSPVRKYSKPNLQILASHTWLHFAGSRLGSVIKLTLRTVRTDSREQSLLYVHVRTHGQQVLDPIKYNPCQGKGRMHLHYKEIIACVLHGLIPNQICFPVFPILVWQLIITVAYLGHGEKTNYSANPPGRNTNPPGRNSQSARAE